MRNLIFILLLLFFVSNNSFSQSAEDYSNSGEEKVKQQNLEGAIQDFSKAIETQKNEKYFRPCRCFSKVAQKQPLQVLFHLQFVCKLRLFIKK